MDNKDTTRIEPVEFVSHPDDVYNPLIGGWEQKVPIVTRGEIVAVTAVILIVLIILGLSLWI